MSEINPPTRPLTVYELYPPVKTTETREVYANEDKSTEEADKVEEAYNARQTETSNSQTVAEEEQVISYDVENGEVTTNTTYSSSSSTQTWVA